jgi:hypothetical protein
MYIVYCILYVGDGRSSVEVTAVAQWMVTAVDQ